MRDSSAAYVPLQKVEEVAKQELPYEVPHFYAIRRENARRYYYTVTKLAEPESRSDPGPARSAKRAERAAGGHAKAKLEIYIEEAQALRARSAEYDSGHISQAGYRRPSARRPDGQKWAPNPARRRSRDSPPRPKTRRRIVTSFVKPNCSTSQRTTSK